MGCCNKFALFAINFIVFGVGVAVVVLASLVISKDSTYGTLLQSGTFSLPIIILVAGLIILLIGFLGCCGALKENSCLLQTYAGIVLILLIAEVILGILILVYNEKAEEIVGDGMKEIFNKYGGEDTALTETLDHAQHDLKCCGTTNYTDWFETDWAKTHKNSVPMGCCKEMTDDCGNNIKGNEDRIYTKGCFTLLKEELGSWPIYLGVACIILAIVQLLSISCACGIAKRSKAYA